MVTLTVVLRLWPFCDFQYEKPDENLVDNGAFNNKP